MSVVCFLGLGVMGFPMAGHLAAQKGLTVRVYNRTFAKAEAWAQKHQGQAFASLQEAVLGADIVFSCLGNDDDVRAICLGTNGAFAAMKKGALFVDHTTTSDSLARELGEAATLVGIRFMDAPVSGGQAGAENGQLTVMAGGSEADYADAEPAVNAYAKYFGLMGPVGAGQQTKMINQVCIAGLVQGLSEGVHLAQKLGLNMDNVLEAIRGGAAQSWQMENRWQTMNEGHYKHGFAVDWMRKDLKFCLDAAARLGTELPVTQLVDGYYREVQEMGGGRWDTSSLLARLNK
ncbi:NAD(P)-dependent oxidoreductase [Polycladidibacter stylochi]|uniref:NAD(P)-dependent oxidoreductase n=1 Tax=Polycladidibacter stylochi TaxID=1807766 RepID=UPI000830AD50|nr:NAD(P)-dependent oxidoreductase [Pseudovibrio stylochi]